jgi:hypothetical protein
MAVLTHDTVAIIVVVTTLLGLVALVDTSTAATTATLGVLVISTNAIALIVLTIAIEVVLLHDHGHLWRGHYILLHHLGCILLQLLLLLLGLLDHIVALHLGWTLVLLLRLYLLLHLLGLYLLLSLHDY